MEVISSFNFIIYDHFLIVCGCCTWFLYFYLKIIAMQFVGLAVVSVVSFTSSAYVAIATNIPVSSCCSVACIQFRILENASHLNILNVAADLSLASTRHRWCSYAASVGSVLSYR